MLSDAKDRHVAAGGPLVSYTKPKVICGCEPMSTPVARARPVNMDQESEQHTERWVINLCSLAAPMAIPQPRAPRLTRFSFFLNHYREDGRRQYRLLMGYFASFAEADKWLATLKKVYPQAFVSEAPAPQPDLMSNTQALRILEVGRVGSVQPITEPSSAVNSHSPDRVQERAAARKAAVPVRKPFPGGTSLEDTLEELRMSEFNMGDDEDPDSTGVRHLRVEVQKDPVTSPRRRMGSYTRK